MEGIFFFFPWIYEKVQGGGGKGVHLRFCRNVFFIVELLGRGSSGVFFFYKFMGGGTHGFIGVFLDVRGKPST